MSSLITSLVTVTVLGGLGIASVTFYLLPVLIGYVRRVPDLAAVAVLDILLGWTLIGWVAALAMALRSPAPPGQVMQFVHNLPASPSYPPSWPSPPPVPGQSPGPGWAGPPGAPAPRPDSPPPLVIPPRGAGTGPLPSESGPAWAVDDRTAQPGG